MKVRLDVLIRSLNFVMQDESSRPLLTDRDGENWITIEKVVSRVLQAENNFVLIQHFIDFEAVDGGSVNNEDLIITLGYNTLTDEFEFLDRNVL